MTKSIAIYSDKGVSPFSLLSVRDYFTDENIKLLTSDDIIRNGISKDIDLFVMPGGADKPYAKKLNGQGNKNIRRYVEQGGTYLGICAGAYYGCSSIEFQKGTSSEICEDRELSFYPGCGTGCLTDLTNPYDLSLNSAAVANISIYNTTIDTFYWGRLSLWL